MNDPFILSSPLMISPQSSGKKRKAEDSAAGATKKKRAPSAFMMFSQAVRPQVCDSFLCDDGSSLSLGQER
jgi:hypothetical protein